MVNLFRCIGHLGLKSWVFQILSWVPSQTRFLEIFNKLNHSSRYGHLDLHYEINSIIQPIAA